MMYQNDEQCYSVESDEDFFDCNEDLTESPSVIKSTTNNVIGMAKNDGIIDKVTVRNDQPDDYSSIKESVSTEKKDDDGESYSAEKTSNIVDKEKRSTMESNEFITNKTSESITCEDEADGNRKTLSFEEIEVSAELRYI